MGRISDGGTPMIVPEARQFDRRAFLGNSLLLFLCGLPDVVQGAELTRGKLDLLVQRALNESDTTPLSRPSILGLADRSLTTKSIVRGDRIHKYGFMVIVPRRSDGLVFF